ncbi:MAG: hypothetical protein WA154_07585 [Moraxellaceae bacterium]
MAKRVIKCAVYQNISCFSESHRVFDNWDSIKDSLVLPIINLSTELFLSGSVFSYTDNRQCQLGLNDKLYDIDPEDQFNKNIADGTASESHFLYYKRFEPVTQEFLSFLNRDFYVCEGILKYKLNSCDFIRSDFVQLVVEGYGTVHTQLTCVLPIDSFFENVNLFMGADYISGPVRGLFHPELPIKKIASKRLKTSVVVHMFICQHFIYILLSDENSEKLHTLLSDRVPFF